MSRLRPRRRRPRVTAAGLDGGLQPERTTLSWGRTGLALVTVSAVFLRWLPHYGPAMLLLPLLTLVCAIAITVTHNRRTHRAVAGIRAEHHVEVVQPSALLALVTVLLVLGLAGIGFVLDA
jgi:hypothetical protein